MHIEFKLPTGAGGMAALYTSKKLRERMQAWADLHNILIKNIHSGYRMCFELGNKRDYTLFALSWQVNNIWDSYTIVHDD